MHLPSVVEDLAVILMVAGAMTLLFRAIKQPVVLGYLIAGFLVGPHFKWLPNVIDTESIKVWAEIGIIFLLFALGLEFSFKKLMRVGAPASITAFVEVAGMVAIGFLLGRAFGWSNFDSVFLGGILSISSTTIIIRAFDELELKTRGFVRLVFGVLIVEDLFAILLLVMLSTIAVSQTFSGTELGLSTLKLAFFLLLWFILGIFLIPSFLKHVQKHLKSETLLIVSLGLCFLMVVLATKVGFSPALGAFIMGSILAETVEGERIEHLIQPVKDLFGAIFFVSVGMLIDPEILVKYGGPIIAITVVTIVGKFLTTTVGALLAGQSLRHSVQAGMSLAQIGEFSFIIAGLGLSLKVTSDFLYPIAISVSAITTFTTPYLIKSADPFVAFLQRRLSTRAIEGLERFRVASSAVGHTSAWQSYFRRSLVRVVLNSVLITSIFLLTAQFANPFLEQQLDHRGFAHGLSLCLAFLLSAPFLVALIFTRHKSEEVEALIRERRLVAPFIALDLGRWMWTMFLVAALASRIVSPGIVILVVGVIVAVAVLFFFRSFETVYVKLEQRFVENLNEKDSQAKNGGLPALAPWDSHLAAIRVSPNSMLAGQTLAELMVRETFGVTIALIERGHTKIAAPGRDAAIYPGDVLQVIGDDEQIVRFSHACEGPGDEQKSPGFDYALRQVYVDAGASYCNKTIRDCGLRERTHGLVVGIEKRGRRTLNPDSSLMIEPGDILWIVGDRKLMEQI